MDNMEEEIQFSVTEDELAELDALNSECDPLRNYEATRDSLPPTDKVLAKVRRSTSSTKLGNASNQSSVNHDQPAAPKGKESSQEKSTVGSTREPPAKEKAVNNFLDKRRDIPRRVVGPISVSAAPVKYGKVEKLLANTKPPYQENGQKKEESKKSGNLNDTKRNLSRKLKETSCNKKSEKASLKTHKNEICNNRSRASVYSRLENGPDLLRSKLPMCSKSEGKNDGKHLVSKFFKPLDSTASAQIKEESPVVTVAVSGNQNSDVSKSKFTSADTNIQPPGDDDWNNTSEQQATNPEAIHNDDLKPPGDEQWRPDTISSPDTALQQRDFKWQPGQSQNVHFQSSVGKLSALNKYNPSASNNNYCNYAEFPYRNLVESEKTVKNDPTVGYSSCSAMPNRPHSVGTFGYQPQPYTSTSDQMTGYTCPSAASAYYNATPGNIPYTYFSASTAYIPSSYSLAASNNPPSYHPLMPAIDSPTYPSAAPNDIPTGISSVSCVSINSAHSSNLLTSNTLSSASSMPATDPVPSSGAVKEITHPLLPSTQKPLLVHNPLKPFATPASVSTDTCEQKLYDEMKDYPGSSFDDESVLPLVAAQAISPDGLVAICVKNVPKDLSLSSWKKIFQVFRCLHSFNFDERSTVESSTVKLTVVFANIDNASWAVRVLSSLSINGYKLSINYKDNIQYSKPVSKLEPAGEKRLRNIVSRLIIEDNPEVQLFWDDDPAHGVLSGEKTHTEARAAAGSEGKPLESLAAHSSTTSRGVKHNVSTDTPTSLPLRWSSDPSRRRDSYECSGRSRSRSSSSESRHGIRSAVPSRGSRSPASRYRSRSPVSLYSRSGSHHRSKSPAFQRRSGNLTFHRRGRNLTFHGRGRNLTFCARSRSPTAHSRGRSPTAHSRGRSPTAHSRGRSPTAHSRGRSPTAHSRGRSPTAHSRGRSPTAHLRGRSPTAHSRGRSPTAHSRGRSPTAHSRSRSPHRQRNDSSIRKEGNLTMQGQPRSLEHGHGQSGGLHKQGFNESLEKGKPTKENSASSLVEKTLVSRPKPVRGGAPPKEFSVKIWGGSMDLSLVAVNELNYNFQGSHDPVYDGGWLLHIPDLLQARVLVKLLHRHRLLDGVLQASLSSSAGPSVVVSDATVQEYRPLTQGPLELHNKAVAQVVVRRMGQVLDIFSYKLEPCTSSGCDEIDCIHYHSRKDRRRDPRQFYYKSEKCRDAWRGKKCVQGDACTPDMFYHAQWEDLYVEGLHNTVLFIAGAVRNLHKLDDVATSGVHVLAAFTDAEVCQQAAVLLDPLAQRHNVKICTIITGLEDPSESHVVLGTLQGLLVLLEALGAEPLSGLCALLLDDMAALFMNRTLSKTFRRLKRFIEDVHAAPERINKVGVCERVKHVDVLMAKEIFSKQLKVIQQKADKKPIKVSEETVSPLAGPSKLPVVSLDNNSKSLEKQHDSFTSTKTEETAESSLEHGSDPTLRKHFIEEEKALRLQLEEEISVFIEVPELHSNYEEKYKEFMLTRKKTNSARDIEEEWNRFWRLEMEETKRLLSAEKRKKLVEKFKCASKQKQLSEFTDTSSLVVPLILPASKQKLNAREQLNLNQRHDVSLSMPNDIQEDISRTNNRSYRSLQLGNINRIHSTRTKEETSDRCDGVNNPRISVIPESLSQATEARKSSRVDTLSNFTMEDALQSLMNVKQYLGVLGSALERLFQESRDKAPPGYFELFLERDNITLYKLCVKKLEADLPMLQSSVLMNYELAISYLNALPKYAKEQLEKLLETSKVPEEDNHEHLGLDIKAVARATEGKSSSFIVNFIKCTLDLQGKTATKHELNKIFLAISELHFDSSMSMSTDDHNELVDSDCRSVVFSNSPKSSPDAASNIKAFPYRTRSSHTAPHESQPSSTYDVTRSVAGIQTSEGRRNVDDFSATSLVNRLMKELDSHGVEFNSSDITQGKNVPSLDLYSRIAERIIDTTEKDSSSVVGPVKPFTKNSFLKSEVPSDNILNSNVDSLKQVVRHAQTSSSTIPTQSCYSTSFVQENQLRGKNIGQEHQSKNDLYQLHYSKSGNKLGNEHEVRFGQIHSGAYQYPECNARQINYQLYPLPECMQTNAGFSANAESHSSNSRPAPQANFNQTINSHSVHSVGQASELHLQPNSHNSYVQPTIKRSMIADQQSASIPSSQIQMPNCSGFQKTWFSEKVKSVTNLPGLTLDMFNVQLATILRDEAVNYKFTRSDLRLVKELQELGSLDVDDNLFLSILRKNFGDI
ncbi:hypothetical protein FHG87_008297 [Trinorchestia longiramus]|nr:hypothetical protein FHG87_008297 [Trinorchestia longiramus]